MKNFIKNNFYIFTGGPGSGKTTTLNILKEYGFLTVPEVGRKIIRDQLAIGGNAIHTGDRLAFRDLMLDASISDFKAMATVEDLVFFDRGIPDLFGYSELIGAPMSEFISDAIYYYRYNLIVFLFPPWELIYDNDLERKQDFSEAIATYEAIKKSYQKSGYQLIEMPKISVNERAALILKNALSNSPHYFTEFNRKSYNKIAKTWAKNRDWYIEKPSIDEAISIIKPKGKILDVGCGSGKPIAQYLLTQGFDVFGIDISEKQIEQAKSVIDPTHLFIGNIIDWETDLKFDAIFCWFVLFHAPGQDQPKILEKLFKLLNKNCVLSITFAHTDDPVDCENGIQVDESTILSKQFGHGFLHNGNSAIANRKLVENSGFIIIKDYSDQPGNQVMLLKVGEPNN